jgi:hypothetical protein
MHGWLLNVDLSREPQPDSELLKNMKLYRPVRGKSQVGHDAAKKDKYFND